MLIENLSINVTPGGIPVTIHISQYDIGLRTFVFSPYTSHGTFTPDSAAAATLEGTKPDGNVIIHNCQYNSTNGQITYTVQEQLAAVAGKVWSKLTLRDTSGNAIGYTAIIWVVDMAGVEDGAIASDSDISALQEFIAEFGTINAYKAALDGALAAVGGPYVASTVSQMTDHSKVYVYTGSQSGYTAGHWYYWNGSAWTDGGVYQAAAVETDKTLTVADMAADAKATGDAVAELKNDLNDISNVVNSLKILSTHNKILDVTAGVTVPTTVHIFDISITAGQYFTFEAKTSGMTSYALYTDGNRLINALIPNEKYCFYASSDISYLSIYTNTVISTGTIDFELFVLKYVEKTGVDYLTEQIGNMQNKYVAIPHILLSGYLNANGTLGITSYKDLHTNLLPVTAGDSINIELLYKDATKTVWLQYERYDSLGNALGRTNINTTNTGGYTGILVVPSDTSFISIMFRTYGDATFNIYKPWDVFADLEEEIDEVEVKTLVSNTVKTIAHRGDDIYAPQCTAPAYIIARKHGLSIAENDLWISEDEEFVMWHDTTLKRLGNLVDINGYLMYTDGSDYYWVHPTTNAVYTYDYTNDEYVASAVSLSGLTRCAGINYSVNSSSGAIGLNLNVLKRIDFGVYKGSKFAGTQILTFEEWVMLCKQLGMEIYVDKKLSYTNDMLTRLANIVKKYGMGDYASWLGIYSVPQINHLRSIIPNARVGILRHPSAPDIETYTVVNTGRGFFFNGDAKNGMTAETIQLGLDAGFEVEVWYVDYGDATSEEVFTVLRNAVSYGVTGITTDHYRVDEAFEYLMNQY